MVAGVEQLPHDGAWTIVAVLVGLIFGAPAVLSSKTVREKLSGLALLPGLRSRWRREALEESSAWESAAVDALTARIKTIQQSAAEEQAWRQRKIDTLRAELDELEESSRRREEALQAELAEALEFIRVATGWARGVLLWAEEKGVELPPPPWKGFFQWKEEQSQESSRGPYPREPPPGAA